MTDHTQDVREIASVPLLSALHDLAVRIPGLAGGCHCNLVAEVVLDALLPAVTPVIRQQERATTDEVATVAELALDHLRRIGCFGLHESRKDELWREARDLTDRLNAAVARSHALPETGEDHEPAPRG